MTEREDIPTSAHGAAGRWLVRRQAGLDASAAAKFAAWLAADPAHGRAFDEAERLWRDSRLLANTTVGRTRSLPRAPFYLRRKTHVTAIGVALAALVGVVALGVLSESGSFAVVSPADATTYETSVGEIRTVALADGSRVTLDTATRMRVRFTADSRRIELVSGRARFHIASDAQRPFMIAVSGGEVTAGGPVFDVIVTGHMPQVAVFEGVVTLHGAREGAGSRMLIAGQQSSLDNAAAPHAIPSPETRWASGMLALDATPLRDAVAAINRYNTVQIRLADPALSSLIVTGAFRVRDPEGFARAVAAMFGLAEVQDGAILTLAPRPGSQTQRP